jgi:hypothetical protein
MLGKGAGEFRFRIESGADGGAALRERIKIFHRKTQPRHPAFNLRGVAGKFLAQRQRRCVLGVGSSDLDESAGTRSARMRIAAGNESFEDWLMLT